MVVSVEGDYFDAYVVGVAMINGGPGVSNI